jgi:splicing factor 1
VSSFFSVLAFPPLTCFRSPSPPPTYDGQGRRTNTREVRYRKKLEDERIRLVERALKNDPNFRPPVEYQQQKRSQRPAEKVYIPVKEFPEINFFGLLVGPRGNSLKKMERDSGAKISIRGKGSVKEGKNRNDQYADDAEEDLHCLVTADSYDKVQTCVKLINKVIETVRVYAKYQDFRLICLFCRLHLLLKVRTITSVTNYES